MFSRDLVQLFLRSTRRPVRRRRQLTQLRFCEAEVLETRALLTATLLVDPTSTNPAVFHTIQAAVNAASSGSTIKVAPGLYNEDVTVSKPLTILGGQVLKFGEKGPSTLEYETTGFTVSGANKLTIEGFFIEPDPASITSTGNAILATNTANSKFDNNVIDTSVIALDGGVTHSEIANNSMPGTFSIEATGGNANDTFTNNTLNGGGFALDFYETGMVLRDNIVKNGGGFVDRGTNESYFGNTAENNEFGFLMNTSGTLTVDGNTANDNGYGFFIAGLSSLVMSDNTADGNSHSGICVADQVNTLLDNTANNNAGGGFQVNGGPSTLIGNIALNNGSAGYSLVVASATIKCNIASNNAGDGFTIQQVSHSTISGNSATKNQGDGIHLEGVVNDTVSDNMAKNNGNDGFDVDSASSGNSFSQNTAFGNTVDDLFDASTGSGTAGTANTWSHNTAHQQPSGPAVVTVRKPSSPACRATARHAKTIGSRTRTGRSLRRLWREPRVFQDRHQMSQLREWTTVGTGASATTEWRQDLNSVTQC